MSNRTIVFHLVLAACMACGLAVPSTSRLHAQPIISTLPAWDGAAGAPLLTRDFFAASVGQTFTTPDDASALNSLSLFLGYSPVFFPNDLDLRFFAYLYGWNGTTLTDLLWQSSLQDGASEIEYAERFFNVGGVPLTAGGQYAVVLSTIEADPFDPALAFLTMFPAYQNVGIVDFDAYAGGALIQSLSADWSSTPSSPWLEDASSDLALELRFAVRETGVPVPEPSTALLLGSSLLMLAFAAHRRATHRATR